MKLNMTLKSLAARIDARSLRERALVFATAAVAIMVLLVVTTLSPLLTQRTVLQAEISQQQDSIGGIDREITRRMHAYAADPDAAARVRLAALDAEAAQLTERLRTMQGGLVAPERIAPLLETILKANGRLQLVSLTTLAPAPVAAAAPGVATPGPAVPEAAKPPPAAPGAGAHDLLYRHGVQLAVRGNYLDMVNYLDALEAMPTRLFWGGAVLEVEEYPNARLTLTLYTLGLERKWIRL